MFLLLPSCRICILIIKGLEETTKSFWIDISPKTQSTKTFQSAILLQKQQKKIKRANLVPKCPNNMKEKTTLEKPHTDIINFLLPKVLTTNARNKTKTNSASLKQLTISEWRSIQEKLPKKATSK